MVLAEVRRIVASSSTETTVKGCGCCAKLQSGLYQECSEDDLSTKLAELRDEKTACDAPRGSPSYNPCSPPTRVYDFANIAAKCRACQSNADIAMTAARGNEKPAKAQAEQQANAEAQVIESGQRINSLQDYRITGKLPRARLTFARPPRCVTGVEVVENVDVNGVGVEHIVVRNQHQQYCSCQGHPSLMVQAAKIQLLPEEEAATGKEQELPGDRQLQPGSRAGFGH